MLHQSPPEVIQITLRDTITITKHDTILKDTIIYRTKWDTLIITEHDSVKDTVKIEIPIEHHKASFKTSNDSLDLEANILYHGFKAGIDTVQFMYDLHYTEEIKRKEKPVNFVWYVGLGLNGGMNFNCSNKTFDFGPSVGLQVGIGIGGKINNK